MKFSDDEIIAAIEQDKPLAQEIEYLYDKNFNSVMKYITSNSGNKQDAEDIFQEALTIFVLKVQDGSYRKESSIGTLLYAIAKNLWFKQLAARRTEEKTTLRDTQFAEIEELSKQLEKRIGAQQAEQHINNIIGQLGKCREILTYFFIDRLSLEEINQRMPEYKNPDVIKVTKHNCFKKMLEKIQTLLDSYN